MQTSTLFVLMRRWRNYCTGVMLMLAMLIQSASTLAETKSISQHSLLSQRKLTLAQANQQSRTRWIEIDLSEQRLKAWEGKTLIYSFRVSTGKRSTPTPVGKYYINAKHRFNRMRGRGYDIPDVPYAMYYYRGYAIHGAYWHNNFGTPVSHGCTNLPVRQAAKLYSWARIGTMVVVHR
jgi:lipoprotein-anchoring transpeptidase ErfK/SrfK